MAAVEDQVDLLQRRLLEKLETLTGFGTPETQAKELKRIFAKFDGDNDGVITRDEFVQALYKLNFFGCEAHVKALFDRYDFDSTGALDAKEFSEAVLGIKATVVHDKKVRSVFNDLRDAIARRGGLNGIRSLGRCFKIMDDSGNRLLNVEELWKGMHDFGVKDFTEEDAAVVMKAFDRDADGNITFDEFLVGLRGKMNDKRKNVVLQAYQQLDETKDGYIKLDDIQAQYDPSFDPDVKAGKKSPDEALREFLSMFDRIERDGIVTQDEFLDYYKDVSASIDDDEYFVQMIQNAWHLEGSTTALRVLVKKLDGTQEIVTLKDSLGVRFGDTKEVRKRLEKQGVKDVAAIAFAE